MRICVNTNALKHLSVYDALHFIKENIGVTDIELTTDARVHAYEYINNKPVSELVDIFRELKMKCVVLSGGWTDFVRQDTQLVQAQVELARVLHVQDIRFFYTNPRLPDDYDETDFIACSHRIKEQALLYPDINFLIENHEGFFGTPDMMHRLLSTVNLPNVQMVFDPGNFMIMPDGMNKQWDTMGASLLHKYIKHIHVKDLTIHREWCTTGEGVVHWKDIVRFMQVNNYQGYYSMEYLGHSKEEAIGREEHLVKSYNNFKGLV